MQSVPLMCQSAAVADELNEMFDDFASDGVLSPDEIEQLDQKIDENKNASMKAELAYSWGMSVLKGGIEGKRAKELELETSRFDDRPSAA